MGVSISIFFCSKMHMVRIINLKTLSFDNSVGKYEISISLRSKDLEC